MVGEDDGAVGVECEQTRVEKAMQVGPKYDTVRGYVVLAVSGWDEVCGFEGLWGGFTGDGARRVWRF